MDLIGSRRAFSIAKYHVRYLSNIDKSRASVTKENARRIKYGKSITNLMRSVQSKCDQTTVNAKKFFPSMIDPSFLSFKKLRPVGAMIKSRLYAKTPGPTDKGGPVRSSGGGLGKLDAANEEGFFYRTNRARVEDLKKELKNKPKDSSSELEDKPEEKKS